MSLGLSFGGCACRDARSTRCPDVNGTQIASYEIEERDFPEPPIQTLTGGFRLPPIAAGDFTVRLERFLKPGSCLRITAQAMYTRDTIHYAPDDFFFQHPITVHGDDNLPNPVIVAFWAIGSFFGDPPSHEDAGYSAFLGGQGGVPQQIPGGGGYIEERFKTGDIINDPAALGAGALSSRPRVAWEYVFKLPNQPNASWPLIGGVLPPISLDIHFDHPYFPGFKQVIKVYGIGDVFAPGNPPRTH
jgi:hypothetical protein